MTAAHKTCKIWFTVIRIFFLGMEEIVRKAIGDCPVCLEPILDPPIHQVIFLTSSNEARYCPVKYILTSLKTFTIYLYYLVNKFVIFSVGLVIHYALPVGSSSTREVISAQHAVGNWVTNGSFPWKRFWKSLKKRSAGLTPAIMREIVKRLSLIMKRTASIKLSNANGLNMVAISKR